MAEAPQSLKLPLSCQVCFEEFTEDGAHVPRLLPCTHTLCHSCIGRMIQDRKLECPECRVKHETKNEEECFPQNKYILSHAKRRSMEDLPTNEEFERCEEHGKELNLFCQSPGCEKPVCRTCLKKHRKDHDVVDIEDFEELQKDNLLKDISAFISNLDEKVEILSDIKTNIRTRSEGILQQLETKREEVNRSIDEMKERMKKLIDVENRRIDVDIVSVKSNTKLLNNIRKSVEKEENMSYNEIMRNKEIIQGIKENNEAHLSGDTLFEFPILTAGQPSPDEFTGRIVMEDVVKKLPQAADMTVIPESKTVTHASQLTCTGMTEAEMHYLRKRTFTNIIDFSIQS